VPLASRPRSVRTRRDANATAEGIARRHRRVVGVQSDIRRDEEEDEDEDEGIGRM